MSRSRHSVVHLTSLHCCGKRGGRNRRIPGAHGPAILLISAVNKTPRLRHTEHAYTNPPEQNKIYLAVENCKHLCRFSPSFPPSWVLFRERVFPLLDYIRACLSVDMCTQRQLSTEVKGVVSHPWMLGTKLLYCK